MDRFNPFYPSKYKERKETKREEWEEGIMAVLADDGGRWSQILSTITIKSMVCFYYYCSLIGSMAEERVHAACNVCVRLGVSIRSRVC